MMRSGQGRAAAFKAAMSWCDLGLVLGLVSPRVQSSSLQQDCQGCTAYRLPTSAYLAANKLTLGTCAGTCAGPVQGPFSLSRYRHGWERSKVALPSRVCSQPAVSKHGFQTHAATTANQSSRGGETKSSAAEQMNPTPFGPSKVLTGPLVRQSDSPRAATPPHPIMTTTDPRPLMLWLQMYLASYRLSCASKVLHFPLPIYPPTLVTRAQRPDTHRG